MSRDKKIECKNNPNVGFLHYRSIGENNENHSTLNDQRNAYVGYFRHAPRELKHKSFLTMLLTKDCIMYPGVVMRNIGTVEDCSQNKCDTMDTDYEILDLGHDEERDWDMIEEAFENTGCDKEAKRKPGAFRDMG